jgi:hypothetical protein
MGKSAKVATRSLRQLYLWSDTITTREPLDATRNARLETLASCGLLLLTYFLLAALAA